MSNHKKSFYAIIPATVRYCDGLCANAKLLYGEITALCNEQGFCWANNHYFADLYNVSKVSVSKWISTLQKEGFIEIEVDKSGGNSRKIFMTQMEAPSQRKVKEVAKKSLRPSQTKVSDPHKEKFKHNNTINNTTNKYISEKEFLNDWNEIRKKKLNKPSFLNSLSPDEVSVFKNLKENYTRENFKQALVGLFAQKKLPGGNSTMQSQPRHFLNYFNSYLTAFHDKNTCLYGKIEEDKL